MQRLIGAFLRHGDYQQLADVPSAWQPFALNAEGIKQAQQAAHNLYDFSSEHQLALSSDIDSSSLLRAWQTADEIRKQFENKYSVRLTIKTYDALCERSVGAAANLKINEIEAILKQDPRYDIPPKGWKSRSDYCLPFPGAESLTDSGKRVARFINQTLASLKPTLNADTLKLFVGHGASFRHAAWLLGLITFDDIAKLSMYHASPIYFEYLPDGSIKQIGGQWKRRQKKDIVMD
jgi:2,3-bisphosphoglycerate-dependent phosphoglycerate mutase